MVALEPRPATGTPSRPYRRAGVGWALAAGGVLVLGLGLRLVLGGSGVGDRSAMLMLVLLSAGVWLGALLVSTPRVAFGVALVAVGALDLAALPVRNAPEYDDRAALFRTGQVVTGRAPVSAPIQQPMLVLLVEPVFPPAASQPQFGLAGEVGGSGPLAWECAFKRGQQHLALALPPTALAGPSPLDVRLHLTGSPSRETDYLLVYASAARGGVLMSLVAAADLPNDSAPCSLRS